VRTLVVASAILSLAVMAAAFAGEERQRPPTATGAFVSAELAGETIKWQLDLGADLGKKTYEMPAAVEVRYIEKEGAKPAAQTVRRTGRDFPLREGQKAVKGTFVSAKLDGEAVLLTIKPAEGDKNLEFTLPKQLTVMYREEGGKLNAFSVGVPRTPREPRAKGAK